MKTSKVAFLLLIAISALRPFLSFAQTASNHANPPQCDGSHDFDFLIGDRKAHIRRLPDGLNSNASVECDGGSKHKKILESKANFEEFEVASTDEKLHIKAQTLRRYNPTSHQWSIYRCR